MYIYPTLNSLKKVLLMKNYFEPHFHDYPEEQGRVQKKEQIKTTRPTCPICDSRLKKRKRYWLCRGCDKKFPASDFEPKSIPPLKMIDVEEIAFDFEITEEEAEEIECD